MVLMSKDYVMTLYRLPSYPPAGTFEIRLGPNGWENPTYHHDKKLTLSPDEVLDFTDFIESCMKEFSNINVFRRYFKNHGERVKDDRNEVMAIYYIGKEMDYIVQQIDNTMLIFPYRKAV